MIDISQLPDVSGVYRLYQQSICIYVGSSVALRTRLRHHAYIRRADAVLWEEHRIEVLPQEELRAIEKYGPTLNKTKNCSRPIKDYCSVRVSAYIRSDVFDLLLKTKAAVELRLSERLSESQAVRMAIRAWAKQEKVK